MWKEAARPAWAYWAACLACAALLGLMTAFNHVKHRGLAVYETEYLGHLRAVTAGEAAGPEQRRPLAAWTGLLGARAAAAAGIPRPEGSALAALRIVQNTAIFLLLLAYCAALGLGPTHGLLGAMALAWGMTRANHGGGLELDHYNEIILLLAGLLLLLKRRPAWLVPVAALAALNRETGLLLPAAGLAMALAADPRPASVRSRAAACCVAAFLVAGGIRLMLWAAYPAGPATGAPGALEQLAANLAQDETYLRFFGVAMLTPLIAAAAPGAWPRPLRALAIAFLPLWCLYHACASALPEAWMWLAPHALVVIPAALAVIGGAGVRTRPADPAQTQAAA